MMAFCRLGFSNFDFFFWLIGFRRPSASAVQISGCIKYGNGKHGTGKRGTI